MNKRLLYTAFNKWLPRCDFYRLVLLSNCIMCHTCSPRLGCTKHMLTWADGFEGRATECQHKCNMSSCLSQQECCRNDVLPYVDAYMQLPKGLTSAAAIGITAVQCVQRILGCYRVSQVTWEAPHNQTTVFPGGPNSGGQPSITMFLVAAGPDRHHLLTWQLHPTMCMSACIMC
jgi:hypothetical protein